MYTKFSFKRVVQKFSSVYKVKVNLKNQTLSKCSTLKSNQLESKFRVHYYMYAVGAGTIKELYGIEGFSDHFKKIFT